MSTKATIFDDEGLHVFEESLDEEICMEFDDFASDTNEKSIPGQVRLRKKRKVFTMSNNSWRIFAKNILAVCDRLDDI